jgi:predicted amino acid dehydrogenase
VTAATRVAVEGFNFRLEAVTDLGVAVVVIGGFEAGVGGGDAAGVFFGLLDAIPMTKNTTTTATTICAQRGHP